MTATSSILLECLHGEPFCGVSFPVWLWIHVVLGLLCLIAVIHHVYLHWGTMWHWMRMMSHAHSKLTRCLAWCFLLTVITGMVVAISICQGAGHTAIGGLHGKIGILVLLLMVFHLLKHKSWFSRALK